MMCSKNLNHGSAPSAGAVEAAFTPDELMTFAPRALWGGDSKRLGRSLLFPAGNGKSHPH